MTTATAPARTECACSTCQSYCQHVPGWFLPDEVALAAAAMRLSVHEFFRRYLTVDYWCADSESPRDIFVLRPRTEAETPGNVAPYDLRGSGCIFYVGGRCGIHANKPHECATARCDIEQPEDWHLQTARAWVGREQVVCGLLGKEPGRPAPSMIDAMSMMFEAFGLNNEE